VSLLRGQGMSTRAIAAVTDVDHNSVVRDLSGAQVVQSAPPESEPVDIEIDEDALAEELIAAEPVVITGLDGQAVSTRPPQVRCRASPVEPSGIVRRLTGMRSLDTIDRELEFLAGVRTAIRRLGGHPSTHVVDELLDERLALRGRTEALVL
jgi:hypothetical protein